MILTSISLFPLRTVLFPDGILPLQIFEVRYLDMINKCIANGTQFGVVSLMQGSEVRQPGITETLAAVGTLARINSWHAPLPGLLQIICTGTMRFHVASSKQLKHGLWVAEVVQIENDQAISIPDELQDAADALSNLIVSMQNEGVSANDAPVSRTASMNAAGWPIDGANYCPLLPRKSCAYSRWITGLRTEDRDCEIDPLGPYAPATRNYCPVCAPANGICQSIRAPFPLR